MTEKNILTKVSDTLTRIIIKYVRDRTYWENDKSILWQTGEEERNKINSKNNC